MKYPSPPRLTKFGSVIVYVAAESFGIGVPSASATDWTRLTLQLAADRQPLGMSYRNENLNPEICGNRPSDPSPVALLMRLTPCSSASQSCAPVTVRVFMMFPNG